MSTNKNNDEVTGPMLPIVDSEPIDAKVTDLKTACQGGTIGTNSKVTEAVLSNSSKSLTGTHEHSNSSEVKDEPVYAVVADNECGKNANYDIEVPMFEIIDSERLYATVSSLKIVRQGGTTDTKSEVMETVTSNGSKSLTGKHEHSNDSKEEDEAIDVAVVDNESKERVNVAAEVSYSATTCEPATADVTKAKVGESAEAANSIETETVSTIVDVIITTENVVVNDKEPETQCKIKGKSVTQATESEARTDPKRASSEQPAIKDCSVAAVISTDSSLKMKIMDSISVVTVSGSSESDITPPVTCFNWFKPQRIISKFISKRDKSLKSHLPSLTSAVSDPSDFEPEIQPEESGKCYEIVFLGFNSSDSKESSLERIDYASLAEEKIIPTYLGCHPCYDVMPTSGKVIILSVELLVKNAFSALVSNDIKAAPLWDASFFDFVGMLTISDFISVLRHYYYSNPEDIKDIENQSIATWRRITEVKKSFVKVNSSESLVQATKLLTQESVHRLPVFDEKRQSVLFVLTRKRLLYYLSNSLFDNFEKTNIKTPSFFRKTIGELKVGTFEDIATVNINTKVIDALDLFVKRNVSSLPVVDKNNVLLDIFEKFDVFQLAKEQTYHNLDMEINEAISKADVREAAWICTMNETFGTVINRFVNNKVHRIVVTDDDRAVVGIISLSDVLKFLVVDPLENSALPSTAETIDEASEGAVGGSSLDSSQKAASLDEDDSSVVSEAVSSLKIEDTRVE